MHKQTNTTKEYSLKNDESFLILNTEFQKSNSVLMGFSDEEFTHYDIVFVPYIRKFGYIQCGLGNNIIDSIGIGIIPDRMYIFNVVSLPEKYYIMDKLRCDEVVADYLARLFDFLLFGK